MPSHSNKKKKKMDTGSQIKRARDNTMKKFRSPASKLPSDTGASDPIARADAKIAKANQERKRFGNKAFVSLEDRMKNLNKSLDERGEAVVEKALVEHELGSSTRKRRKKKSKK